MVPLDEGIDTLAASDKTDMDIQSDPAVVLPPYVHLGYTNVTLERAIQNFKDWAFTNYPIGQRFGSYTRKLVMA